jgi:hypothetical protein
MADLARTLPASAELGRIAAGFRRHDDAGIVVEPGSGGSNTVPASSRTQGAGNSDDYTLAFSYIGLTTSCDLPLAFDAAEVSSAGCWAGGDFPLPSTTQIAQTGPEIFFNDGFSWFFNDVSNAPKPVPSLSLVGSLCIGAACLGGAWARLRASDGRRRRLPRHIPRSG